MDPKPGYTTTEFWGTLLVHLITTIVTISSMFTHTPFDASGLQPLIPVASLVMSGIAQAYYSHSRAHIKVAQQGTAQAALAAGPDNTTGVLSQLEPGVLTAPTPQTDAPVVDGLQSTSL